MTRLHLETTHGDVSESVTYSQLIEFLRKGAEACYTLGHLRKACDDTITGEGFLKVGQNLERTVELVTQLATGKTRI